MKPGIVIATFVVGLSALGVLQQSNATSDVKQYHGSDCKVFGSTAWTDLAFSGYGVKNLASSARQVICPLTKDQETAWDGTATGGANGRIYVQAGAVNAAVTCTVYVTTNHDGVVTVNTYAHAFGVLPANTETEAFIAPSDSASLTSVPGGNNWEDKAYMLCTLGPQTRLKGYYLYEHGATHIPSETVVPNLMFTTSGTYTGNLGGLAGADATCQALASGAGLEGHYLAYLGATGTNAPSRFAGASGWTRVDGSPMINQIGEFGTVALAYPPSLDEAGNDLTSSAEVRVWTATNADTTYYGQNCNAGPSDWSTTMTQTLAGTLSATNSNVLNIGTASCAAALHLYCFGIDRAATLP